MKYNKQIPEKKFGFCAFLFFPDFIIRINELPSMRQFVKKDYERRYETLNENKCVCEQV